ncbi:Coenzyme F420 hydrogenase/dehydrogenase, beta subunit C-terminal domain [Limimaricola litoreus]|uniref:Coenzyme F420 hydrogenase/dehydrogenase, beta subunit C-terminal domain n=1 Tax=Limimaricola litoreus TaxID=2955316 RepID=A0A9X2JQK1_9RHOB|nr:Coenzyme F420 hydrogenase/dehydrogenase, beta subunit C-terminal domain [Limimaricola litoreus]
MTSKAEFLTRVERGDLCSGCGGCALASEGAIEMGLSAPGFLRPVQRAAIPEETDRRIAAICPGLGQTLDRQATHDDVLWGPYEEMRTGWASAPELRHAASSGGALSAVLGWLIESGKVEAAVHVAADSDRPTANRVTVSRDAAEIKAAAGSRYAPSAPLAALGSLIARGGRYAFVGKPCDIVALRALARQDARIDACFPVMLSFFCAGVPSLAGADAVLAALGTTPDQVSGFRYRGNGWPGEATATLRDGTARSMSYHDSWGKILSGHVQRRCKICPDGTGKEADLVCADAWQSDARGYPLFTEQEGVSLVVARTPLGRDLMAGAEAAGALTTEGFDVTTLDRMQPGQSGRRRAVLARLAGLRLAGRPIPRYRGLRLAEMARSNTVKGNLRNMLGMFKRVVGTSRRRRKF